MQRYLLKIGEWASWLNLLLIVCVITQLSLRHGAGEMFMLLEELQWHICGVIIMLGICYADLDDSHIRVETLASRFPPKLRRMIDILGILLFLFPFLWVVTVHGLDFVREAYTTGESSHHPGGLAHRWVIKSMIPLTMVLLFLSSLLRLWRGKHDH